MDTLLLLITLRVRALETQSNQIYLQPKNLFFSAAFSHILPSGNDFSTFCQVNQVNQDFAWKHSFNFCRLFTEILVGLCNKDIICK